MKNLINCLALLTLFTIAACKEEDDSSCLGCGAGIYQYVTVYLANDTLNLYENITVSGIDDSLGNQTQINISATNNTGLVKITLPMPPPADSMLTVDPHIFTTDITEHIYLNHLGHNYYLDSGSIKYYSFGHLTGPGFMGVAEGNANSTDSLQQTIKVFFETYNWPGYH